MLEVKPYEIETELTVEFDETWIEGIGTRSENHVTRLYLISKGIVLIHCFQDHSVWTVICTLEESVAVFN